MRNHANAWALTLLSLLTSVSALATGCGGEGTIRVTAWGESYIEDGIPASAVDDGWAVTFERFAVSLRDVTMAGQPVSTPATIELAAPSSGQGHPVGSATVPAGDHTAAIFTVTQLSIRGQATKGATTKTFDWVLEPATRYDECEATTSVPSGGEATFQITVHADHLLYDSLASNTPRVLFQPLADADTNGDGVITRPELAATDIGAYDPGSGGGINDLWTWLTALSQTVGHVNGEGHCHSTPAN